MLGDRHEDCGILIYNESDTQDTHAGGSGCGCAAATLAAYILPQTAFAVSGTGFFWFPPEHLCPR